MTTATAEEKFMLVANTIAFMLMPGLIWLSGYLTSKLWFWFAVPVFGIRPISVSEAIGIGILGTRFFRSGVSPTSKDDPFYKIVGRGAFFSAATFGIGAIIRFWVM